MRSSDAFEEQSAIPDDEANMIEGTTDLCLHSCLMLNLVQRIVDGLILQENKTKLRRAF